MGLIWASARSVISTAINRGHIRITSKMNASQAARKWVRKREYTFAALAAGLALYLAFLS